MAAAEGGLDGGLVAFLEAVGFVAGVPQCRSTLGQGGGRVDDARKRGVVDNDLFGGIAGGGRGLGDDEGDGIAGEAGLAVG